MTRLPTCNHFDDMNTNIADPHPGFYPLNQNNLSTALIGQEETVSYAELNRRIEQLACDLLGGKADLGEERIAFLMSASIQYAVTLFAIWRAGGIAVPLNVTATLPEIHHVLSCAGVTRLLTGASEQPGLGDVCASLNIQILPAGSIACGPAAPLPEIPPERRAMILFTSGTTSKPKGVVSTHKNIHAQVSTLVKAWAWRADDTIPLFLPLHHIHGIINILCSALWSGATVTLFPRFDIESILADVADGRYSLFMAVPTIYIKIIQRLESLPEADRRAICAGFAAMRLNVSGSAACPVKLFDQWQTLTGQSMLERYGMTEIGMAISNPYIGERRAGAVGLPLPGVEVALFDDRHEKISAEHIPGEIRIRGDNVFLEYWQNPGATASSFHAGWFCTGDIAVIESGYFRIMGRASTDIIKSGGYKLSALEIEGTLLTHEAVTECAVIGVEDETWGEAVTAFVVLKPDSTLDYETLKSWCAARMSPYKIPKHLRIVASLPRNAMGKVTKPELKKMF